MTLTRPVTMDAPADLAEFQSAAGQTPEAQSAAAQAAAGQTPAGQAELTQVAVSQVAMAEAMPHAQTDLLVCVTCRSTTATAAPDLNPDLRAGAILAAALAARPLPEGLRILPVECLSNCDHGCTIALRGAGRWSYVYGNLDPATHTETILDGAARYHASPDGLVPWRERPEHFRKNCIARIPPLAAPQSGVPAGSRAASVDAVSADAPPAFPAASPEETPHARGDTA